MNSGKNSLGQESNNEIQPSVFKTDPNILCRLKPLLSRRMVWSDRRMQLNTAHPSGQPCQEHMQMDTREFIFQHDGNTSDFGANLSMALSCLAKT